MQNCHNHKIRPDIFKNVLVEGGLDDQNQAEQTGMDYISALKSVQTTLKTE